MLLKVKRGWELPENAATDESVYVNRRALMKGLGAGVIAAPSLLASMKSAHSAIEEDPTAKLYPVDRNEKYKGERPLDEEEKVLAYNNFYEFGSHKYISSAAQAMPLRPWTVTIDGLVEEPMQIDFDSLIGKVQLEERVYRHRCVERWAMTVPWSGFTMDQLVKIARPKSDAKYIMMKTLADESSMPGLKAGWFPWPYTEGVRIDEAMNELTFLATGLYGKPVPKQNGAPLRLVLPWKYGFKSIKSIVSFTFTSEQPVGFWEELQAKEYGFWANVNPEVSHPRWSQAYEELLSSRERIKTRVYNGYGEYVAHMYDGMEQQVGERLFR